MSLRNELRCEVDGCDRKVMATGLCAMHYARVRKTGSLELPKPSKEYKAMYARWENIKKRYPDCEWKTFKEFSSCVGYPSDFHMSIFKKDDNKPIGPFNFEWAPRKCPTSKKPNIFNTKTKEGRAAYDRHILSKNPDRNRSFFLARNYGLTIEKYNEMLVSQKACCAICKQPETHTRRGKLMALNVDHNHETGMVRGLLCLKCNRGLGFFRDNKDYLANAISYLSDAAEPLAGNVVPLKKKEL